MINAIAEHIGNSIKIKRCKRKQHKTWSIRTRPGIIICSALVMQANADLKERSTQFDTDCVQPLMSKLEPYPGRGTMTQGYLINLLYPTPIMYQKVKYDHSVLSIGLRSKEKVSKERNRWECYPKQPKRR